MQGWAVVTGNGNLGFKRQGKTPPSRLSCLFLQSPITHTALGDGSLALTEAMAFVVWVQVALVSGMSLQIFSQQLHKAVSPNCVCLPHGISFSSLLLPLPAHLCGRKDRLMGIVLAWCRHAGIRSRTLCVTGKLSAY